MFFNIFKKKTEVPKPTLYNVILYRAEELYGIRVTVITKDGSQLPGPLLSYKEEHFTQENFNHLLPTLMTPTYTQLEQGAISTDRVAMLDTKKVPVKVLASFDRSYHCTAEELVKLKQDLSMEHKYYCDGHGSSWVFYPKGAEVYIR